MTLWPVASEGALVVQNLLVSAGDIREAGLIPGLGRSPGGGHDNLFQYSCLENPMDREAWWSTVHGVTRVGHDLAAKQPSPMLNTPWSKRVNVFLCY